MRRRAPADSRGRHLPREGRHRGGPGGRPARLAGGSRRQARGSAEGAIVGTGEQTDARRPLVAAQVHPGRRRPGPAVLRPGAQGWTHRPRSRSFRPRKGTTKPMKTPSPQSICAAGSGPSSTARGEGLLSDDRVDRGAVVCMNARHGCRTWSSAAASACPRFVAGIVIGRWRLRRVVSGRWFQGQRSPRLKLTASKGRTCTGSASIAVAISTHSPSRSSKASKVRSIGSTSHRCATPSRA